MSHAGTENASTGAKPIADSRKQGVREVAFREVVGVLNALPDELQDLATQTARAAGARAGSWTPTDRRGWAQALTAAEDALELRRGAASEATRLRCRAVRRALEETS
jgi:hypothetical protein